MQSADLTADLYKCADITLSYLFSDNFQAPTFPIRAGSLSNLSRSRLDRQETVNTAVLIAICSSTGIITKRNTPKLNGISMALLTQLAQVNSLQKYPIIGVNCNYLIIYSTVIKTIHLNKYL